MTTTLPLLTGFLAGLTVAVGVHAVLRAREWPARERLGAWAIAGQLWVLAAILIGVALFVSG